MSNSSPRLPTVMLCSLSVPMVELEGKFFCNVVFIVAVGSVMEVAEIGRINGVVAVAALSIAVGRCCSAVRFSAAIGGVSLLPSVLALGPSEA